jgi:hypothetical protein
MPYSEADASCGKRGVSRWKQRTYVPAACRQNHAKKIFFFLKKPLDMADSKGIMVVQASQTGGMRTGRFTTWHSLMFLVECLMRVRTPMACPIHL